jgi:molecular chaperone GrpE
MSKKKKNPPVEDEAMSNEAEINSSIPTEEIEESEVTVEEPIVLEPIEVLEKDLQETKDELEEQKDKFIRLQAETDNFRKRLSREKEEFSQYANERLFKELIPIFDNFERALEDPSNEIKSLKEGLDMILKQFNTFLEKENVEPIKAIGE